MHLVRGRERGGTLALVAAVFMVLGGFGHMGYATWQVTIARIPYAPDRAGLSDFLDRQQAATTPVLLPLYLCIVVGVMIQAIALRRAGVVPRWFLVAVVAMVGVDLVMNSTSLSDSKGPIVFIWAALSGLYAYLGVRVLAMGTREWDNPTALPGVRDEVATAT